MHGGSSSNHKKISKEILGISKRLMLSTIKENH